MTHGASDGEVELRQHVAGVESTVATCTSEFHARIENGGDGYMLEQTLTGTGCTRQPCKVSGEAQPWQFDLAESGSVETMTTSICTEPVGGGTDSTCEVPIPFEETAPGSHTYVLGQSSEMPGHGADGSRCELLGEWVTETGGTHDSTAEEEVLVNPQEFWLDKDGTKRPKTKINNSTFGEQVSFHKAPETSFQINTATTTITCSHATLETSIRASNDTISGLQWTILWVDWALFQGCTDSLGRPVRILSFMPWRFDWTTRNTLQLGFVGFRAYIGDPIVQTCTFTSATNVVNFAWIHGDDSKLQASSAPLTVTGCTGPGSITATYTPTFRSGPDAFGLWLL